MKTGRLLKFRGPEGEVQAYLYREAQRHYATIYLSSPDPESDEASSFTLSGADELEVEQAVRRWVAERRPQAR